MHLSWGKPELKFKALNVSANGNLVLSSKENAPVSRKMQLFMQGSYVGELFDTIGSVARPFYLARTKGDGKELVGKVLEGK